MRALVLYHPAGEHTADVETYVGDFNRVRPDRKLELISLETPEGARLAELYGLSQYPAILVITDDGQLIRLWQDGTRPLISELASYSG